ncbi:MAG: TraK family protein [Alphaproteobacteria bacterium]
MQQKTKPSTRKGQSLQGRVGVIARADEIRKALAAGYPRTAIYERYAADLDISYSQFCRHIQRYLLADTACTTNKRAAKPVRTALRKRSNGPIQTPTSAPKKFVFDPTAAHARKDELF